jgi:hypothetical protein
MISHKQRLEEIEAFLFERKKEYAMDIRKYVHGENNDSLDEFEKIQLQMAECNILLIEQMGNTFFNWE